MNNKLKPALMAGGALGLLSVLTVLVSSVPVLGLAGCCNCLWPIATGILATMFYVRSSPTPATASDAAIVGALSGAIGGLIYLIIGMPISYLLTGAEAIDMQIRQLNPNFPLSGAILLVIGGLVGFVIFIVLSTLGGLIGLPIFEKRKGHDIPPSPPQNFG